MGELFSFSGRAGRLAYWGITILCGVVIFGLTVLLPESKLEAGQISFVTLMAAIFAFLATLWVSLAVTVRRFHDRGKSGLWILALFIPLIGLWFSIELAFFSGTDDGNDYGATL